jgi:hypothetical protein
LQVMVAEKYTSSPTYHATTKLRCERSPVLSVKMRN